MIVLLDASYRQALLQHERKAWDALLMLVRQSARSAAYQIGALGLEDEITSEVMLLLHERLLQRLPDGAPLGAFVAEVCRRVAMAQRRKLRQTRSISLFDEAGDPIVEELVPDDLPQQQAKLRAEQAIQRTQQALRTAQNHRQAARMPRQQYGCGDHELARELKRQRQRLGWSQKQAAAYMGLKLCTYISYEHACVKVPSPSVLEGLRRMQAEPSAA